MTLPPLPEAALDDLLRENRRFPPPAEFRERARVSNDAIYREAEADPEVFWARWAGELHWFTPWTEVLEWEAPRVRWFSGGELNVAYNCLDRHLNGPRRNQAALI